MEYKVRTIASRGDIARAEPADISVFRWEKGYSPKTQARLGFVPGEGFALRMTCFENAPKAIYKNQYDPVYKDSCMEFFVSFGGGYINFEMNSNGASLMGFGPDRNDRTRLDSVLPVLPKVYAEKKTGEWSVSFFLTLDDIKTVFGVDPDAIKRGFRFRGNFYKCGDDCEHPHYGMWSPVLTEKPDFHRPEYFGELVID